jgi:hypothetical protein
MNRNGLLIVNYTIILSFQVLTSSVAPRNPKYMSVIVMQTIILSISIPNGIVQELPNIDACNNNAMKKVARI